MKQLERSHIRLLSDLLIHNKPPMKGAWFESAYDGDHIDIDRTFWYDYMDELVKRKLVREIKENYGTAIEWTFYEITFKGEQLLVDIMEEEN